MINKVVLKVSDRVYKVIENQSDIDLAKYFLPSGFEIDINDFFRNI